ncbi:MAG: site-specific DNA-methyltransferase [Methanobrevibacter sp.]|jgi:adenine-specific DNA-methyltransferase|nr:site-specific DNA-methyltransferase [Candidatus Methanovirga meridionalis]
MSNFYEKLINILKEEDNFIDENNDLIKNEVINATLKCDRKLIQLLIKDKQIKELFFHQIDEYLVFDSNKFIEYMDEKSFLDNSYTKFKNKIGLNIDNKFLNERGEVSLVWPYKDCVLEGGMNKEDKKRNEIFFNETLAQDEIDMLFDKKVLTNFKRYDTKGEHEVLELEKSDNLIIKGNNLLALHSLKEWIKKQGGVKLIYIDPPYNTDNDSFRYNDKFNHSTWLTFMKNRLEIARELLCDDGAIFVSCDDREQAYLKVLMDEIFEKENFVGQWNWFKSATPPNLSLKIKKNIEYILAYEKKKNNNRYKGVKKFSKSDDPFTKPQNSFKQLIFPPNSINFKINNKNIKKGTYGTEKYPNHLLNDVIVKNFKNENEAIFQNRFIWTQEKLNDELKKKTVVNCSKSIVLSYKKQNYLEEVPPNLIDNNVNVSTTEEGGKDLTAMFGEKVFDYPKPENLIKYIFEMTTKENDLILDFCLGSGTTVATAHKLNRQYIGIEQMDYIKNITVERIKKVIDGEHGGISKSINWGGGGSFVYCELMEFNEEAMKFIQKSENTEEIMKIWELMCKKYFLNYNLEINKFNENLDDFKTLSSDEQKKILCEMLNKNQLYVNFSEIDDSQFNISEKVKKLNKAFYGDHYHV